MTHVLIVDDQADLASLIEFNLRQAGYEARIAGTGSQAVQSAREKRPALVLLDLMLPDMSGLDVCRTLKTLPDTRDVPVVMLTARGEEHERVAGLEIGAEDYVVKPFSVRELVLRVKAILRRTAPAPPGAPPLTLGVLRLEPSSHKAYVNGQEIQLTVLEFRLLMHLMTRPGRVQTRDRLLADVWGISSPLETRTVDTHVMRLRDKLGEARAYVETVRGVGYRMIER